MRTILLVSGSSRGNASYSKQIAETLTGDLRKKDPNARLIVRDLAWLRISMMISSPRPAAQTAHRRRDSARNFM